MSRATSSANVIATIGIDIGIPCHRSRRQKRDHFASEAVARPSVCAARQYSSVPARHGGVRRGASPGPTPQGAWPRHAADASPVCALLSGLLLAAAVLLLLVTL